MGQLKDMDPLTTSLRKTSEWHLTLPALIPDDEKKLT